MPQFKVYAAEVMPVGDVAVIITTAFTNPDGYPRAESFLIIPDEECTLCMKSLSFEVKSFKNSPVELNEEFMLQEALNQALVELRLYVDRLSEKKGFGLPCARPEFIEDNQNLLVHLWVRGRCFERLDKIARKTQCEPLHELLNRIVSSLPQIRRDEL